jgi:hypothetical protein
MFNRDPYIADFHFKMADSRDCGVSVWSYCDAQFGGRLLEGSTVMFHEPLLSYLLNNS